MKRHVCILLSAITCVFLAACLTVGPDYVPPTAGVPDAWHAAAVGGLAGGEPDLQTWWTTFQDPLLTDLIERAGSSNLSARIALARIEEARAQLASTRGERLPDVDGIGTAQRIRSSEAITPSIPPGLSRTDTFYQAGFDAVWELDTWGRIRRSIESADASYAATIEDYRDVMVSLYAEVAAA